MATFGDIPPGEADACARFALTVDEGVARMLRNSIWIVAWMVVCGVHRAAGADLIHIEEPADDTRVFGVGLKIQITGEAQTVAADGKPQPLALEATATLSYRERRLLGPGVDAEALRTVRQYEMAESEISIGGEQTRHELSRDVRLLVAQGRSEGVDVWPVTGTLTSGEFELLSTPGDSLALTALLPSKEVEAGAKFTPPAWALQMLSGLDAVLKQESTVTVKSVDAAAVVVAIQSKLEGAIDGASSTVSLKGTLKYDRKLRCLVSAELEQSEQRSVGPISPGLNVVAKIRLLRQPAQDAGKLADAALIERAAAAQSSEQATLRFDAPWGVSIQYPREWRVFHATDKTVVFRLLDDGALVAQCNVSSIPAAAAGSHTPEAEFLADVKTALGPKFESVELAREFAHPQKYYAHQLAIRGKAGMRGMVWRYYLLADPSGRQASAVVSVDRELAEKLGERHEAVISGLRFLSASRNPASAKRTP